MDPVSLGHWDQDDQYELGGAHCFLPQGYGAVIEAMAAKLNVQFGQVVKRVEYSASGVTVHTEANTLELKNPIQLDLQNATAAVEKDNALKKENKLSAFNADIVINTLPLGMLQSKYV